LQAEGSSNCLLTIGVVNINYLQALEQAIGAVYVANSFWKWDSVMFFLVWRGVLPVLCVVLCVSRVDCYPVIAVCTLAMESGDL